MGASALAWAAGGLLLLGSAGIWRAWTARRILRLDPGDPDCERLLKRIAEVQEHPGSAVTEPADAVQSLSDDATPRVREAAREFDAAAETYRRAARWSFARHFPDRAWPLTEKKYGRRSLAAAGAEPGPPAFTGRHEGHLHHSAG